MPLADYTPRDASASALYTIVRDHFETFRAEAARTRGGDGLPRFVEDEFRAFLRCGFLAGGFARFRCADHALPDVPVRQWVLTVPHRLRYLLAWHHDVCRGVVRVLHRAIERHLREWARAHGVPDPRGGGVAVIQRFGGAANLHVHVHALVLDGVFARTGTGALRFHVAPAPSAADMADVMGTIVPAIRRLLGRHGFDDADHTAVDPFAEATPLLAEWAAASIQGVDASGQRPRRLGPLDPPAFLVDTAATCHARWEGFDLHAGVRVPAGHRDRLERVCCYALRPPLATERLCVTAAGEVAVQLRRPWADRTTHVSPARSRAPSRSRRAAP